MWGVEIAVMFGMIVLNGFFAAYEIALASIARSRLQMAVQQKRVGAAAALRMKDNIEGSLAVVQLGITMVGAVAAAIAGAGAEESISPYFESWLGFSPTMAEICSIIAVVFPLTMVTIVFGELIPKVFALRNQERVCLRLSPALSWFGLAAYPLVWALEASVHGLLKVLEKSRGKRKDEHVEQEAIAYQELKASVAIARTSRLIGSHVENIILRAAELSQQPVTEVMLPAEFISMLDANSTASEALLSAHLDLHTRFPVTMSPGDPQGISGYVTFKDLVTFLRFSPRDAHIKPLIRHIVNFAEETSAADCMERLIRHHAHIAVIRNREHEVIGIITLEDLIEELVGDIEDEFDRIPAHVVPIGDGWIVGGGLRLQTLKEKTGLELTLNPPDPEVRTVSDWIEHQLDGPIHGSEVVESSTVKASVRKSRRHRVLEALLQPKEPPPEEIAPLPAPMPG